MGLILCENITAKNPYYIEELDINIYSRAVDLSGLPKDRFYLYRSHWNKETLINSVGW